MFVPAAPAVDRWGNYPAWVAGLATALAVLVAAATLVRGLLDRQREQASRVWVWSDYFSYSHGDNDDQPNEARIRVHNESDGPVFEVGVNLLGWDWRDRRERHAGRLFATIEPRSQSAITDIWPIPPPTGRMGGINPPLELHFTDGAGVDWIRRPDARLRRVKAQSWQFWRFEPGFRG